MKAGKHSKKYAVMFLNAVGMEGAPKALEELALVDALMEKSLGLRSLVASPLFGDVERRDAFNAVGKKLKLSENAVKFVNYLADVGAAGTLGDITSRAVAIYSEKKMMVSATVITPSDGVGREHEDRLREALMKITSRDVTIEYRTDPALLGGMLIKVGSTMFDGSIKGQLRLLKEELIKG